MIIHNISVGRHSNNMIKINLFAEIFTQRWLQVVGWITETLWWYLYPSLGLRWLFGTLRFSIYCERYQKSQNWWLNCSETLHFIRQNVNRIYTIIDELDQLWQITIYSKLMKMNARLKKLNRQRWRWMNFGWDYSMRNLALAVNSIQNFTQLCVFFDVRPFGKHSANLTLYWLPWLLSTLIQHSSLSWSNASSDQNLYSVPLTSRENAYSTCSMETSSPKNLHKLDSTCLPNFLECLLDSLDHRSGGVGDLDEQHAHVHWSVQASIITKIAVNRMRSVVGEILAKWAIFNCSTFSSVSVLIYDDMRRDSPVLGNAQE